MNEAMATHTDDDLARAIPLRPGLETSESAEAPTLRPEGAWWAWHPLHGGSTASTLAAALPGGVELDELPLVAGYPGLHVVLVTRSHHAGLMAAQEWAATHPPGSVMLAGLVVVADAPGRVPRPLETLIRLVGGAYPAVWRVPWVPAWRLGEAPTPENTPATAKQLLIDLATLAGLTNERVPPQ